MLSIETAAIVLFFVSFYGLISGKSIIKSIISIGLMETAVVLFFLGIGFTAGDKPPIGGEFDYISDPLPQALVITAIIIGVAVTAINVVMFISLYKQHKVTDWSITEDARQTDTEG